MRMKILFLTWLSVSFLATKNLTAQIKLPSPSTIQTIQQEFGLGSIEVTYSRPGAKGRKVFGDLVPYGKLWRTGANAATRITFSDAVELNGRKIDAGTYVLYTIVITANIKEKMRTQIEKAMLTDKKPYWQAAQFYYEYDMNLSKALENVNKASDANPTAYWIYLYKAKIQKDMGDNAGALKTSQTSMEFAKQAKAEDYIKMNKAFQKKIKKS